MHSASSNTCMISWKEGMKSLLFKLIIFPVERYHSQDIYILKYKVIAEEDKHSELFILQYTIIVLIFVSQFGWCMCICLNRG